MEYKVLVCVFICCICGNGRGQRFSGPPVQNVIACEHANKPTYISCTAPATIQVFRANYGRTSRSVCPGWIRTTNCWSSNSLAVMKNQCNGKQLCRLSASNSLFGDPCKYTNKYLEVGFFCRRG